MLQILNQDCRSYSTSDSSCLGSCVLPLRSVIVVSQVLSVGMNLQITPFTFSYTENVQNIEGVTLARGIPRSLFKLVGHDVAISLLPVEQLWTFVTHIVKCVVYNRVTFTAGRIVVGANNRY